VISRLLPSLRRKEEDPFMEKKALVLKIQLKKCPELDSAVLDKVVEFLDETGEVRYFKQNTVVFHTACAVIIFPEVHAPVLLAVAQAIRI
jgi:hypothetical protein